MDPAELDVVQFGKIARATGQHGKDVMWRAVVRSEEKLRTPVFEFQRCHVVDVREHADGTFTTVVRMDDASVAQLLELEDKAVERLGGLGAGGDAHVASVLGEDRDVAEVFVSRAGPASRVRFDRQRGPCPVEVGQTVDLEVAVVGVATCFGHRNFSLVWEVRRASASPAVVVVAPPQQQPCMVDGVNDDDDDDEFDDDDGPGPDDIDDMKEKLESNALEISRELHNEFMERQNMVKSIRVRISGAKVNELERLASELELCASRPLEA